MKRIGILGLDTSHPPSFGSVLEEMPDATVTGLWDGGAVRTGAYARELATRFDAALYETPSEMVGDVDGVLVTAVNWDTHLSLARPFLAADVPTLIDKPVAGRVSDVDDLERLAAATPLFGGSAVPFHPQLSGFPRDSPDRLLYGVGYNDPFYYGVHMTDSTRRLAGADWNAVRPTDHPGTTVDIAFENGTRALLRLDAPEEERNAFGFLDVSDRTRSALVGGNAEEHQSMYRAYLRRFLDVIDGTHDETARVLDGARLLVGVHAALENEVEVGPDSEHLGRTHVDGAVFQASYSARVSPS